MPKFYYSLGFMSGTSLDGIDASIIKSDGEKFVEVEIRDNGEGIVEENRSSIFNCGFSSKPGHLGIGLHQAFNFMIEMGGGLVLKNEEKKEGSSFGYLFSTQSEILRGKLGCFHASELPYVFGVHSKKPYSSWGPKESQEILNI